MNVNIHERTLQENIQSFINLMHRITDENVDAEFINLDYHVALIKMAIKKQLKENNNANTL